MPVVVKIGRSPNDCRRLLVHSQLTFLIQGGLVVMVHICSYYRAPIVKFYPAKFIYPPKANVTIEIHPFKDVFPIKHHDFRHVIFRVGLVWREPSPSVPRRWLFLGQRVGCFEELPQCCSPEDVADCTESILVCRNKNCDGTKKVGGLKMGFAKPRNEVHVFEVKATISWGFLNLLWSPELPVSATNGLFPRQNNDMPDFITLKGFGLDNGIRTLRMEAFQVFRCINGGTHVWVRIRWFPTISHPGTANCAGCVEPAPQQAPKLKWM